MRFHMVKKAYRKLADFIEKNIGAITMFALMFFLVCLYIQQDIEREAENIKTEIWVTLSHEYAEEKLSQQEIDMIADAVLEHTGTFSVKESSYLSDEQMRQLYTDIVQIVRNNAQSLAEHEIREAAAAVMTELLTDTEKTNDSENSLMELKIQTLADEYEKLQVKVDTLEENVGTTQNDIDSILSRLSGIESREQLLALASEVGMTVEELRQLISSNQDMTQQELEQLQEKLNLLDAEQNDTAENIAQLADRLDMETEELAGLVTSNKVYTKETVEELAKKLGAEDELLWEALAGNNGGVDITALEALAKQLNLSVEELQMQIIQNLNLTRTDIEALAKKVGLSDDALRLQMESLESETHRQMAALSGSLDATADNMSEMISSNKELTDEDIRILANRLNISVEELMSKISDGERDTQTVMERLSHEFNISVTELYGQLDAKAKDLSDRIEQNQEDAINTTRQLQDSLLKLSEDIKASEELTQEDIKELAVLLAELSSVVEHIEKNALYVERYDADTGTLYITGGEEQ